MILVNKALKVAYSGTKPEMVIGRAPECDLQLNHPTISKRHVVLTEENESWYVEDQGSANLTYINGEKLHEKRKLTPGDFLRLDIYTLVFFQKDPPQLPEIVVQDGSSVVRHRLPFSQPALHLGRSLVNNHIAIDDVRISGRHCSLQRQDRRWLVTSSKPEATIRVNQEKAESPVLIQVGDKVQLGNSTLEITAPIVREWGGVMQVHSRLQDLYKTIRVQARTVEDALHENFPASKGEHFVWIQQVLEIFEMVNASLNGLQETANTLRSLLPTMESQESDSVILAQALRDSRRSTNLGNYIDLFLRNNQLVRIQNADIAQQRDLVSRLHQDVLSCIQQDAPTLQLK